jgi:Restriction Enzyme Adenine Methylase Associated/Type I restriction enzyme R protein N terminus (HSDR_N)
VEQLGAGERGRGRPGVPGVGVQARPVAYEVEATADWGLDYRSNQMTGKATIHPMPDDDRLAEVLVKVRNRIDSLAGEPFGEQNTKMGLIAPILRALGWDTEDFRQVHLEYRPMSADNPVDYALMLNGQPRMFVEAKGLGQNLEDRKWAGQIMGYAGVAGVKWVVLTNGDEYRVYNSHADVPVEKKMFRKVRVSDPTTNPEETLALLSKENVAELQALWQEEFVDRQVKDAIDRLFEPEPHPGLVRLLRSALPDLKPREISAAISRVHSASPPQTVAQTTPIEPKPAKEQAARAHGAGTPWGTVTLGDIISSGSLRPPVDLFRKYKGHDLTARIERDGRVSFGGHLYGSLSVAAQMARRTVIGEDQRAQTNGWTFWKYRDEGGELHELDVLRHRLWESKASR